MSWIHSDKDFVLDSHCDTPGMLLEGVDLGKRQKRGHVDFVRAREGGVDGMFFAIYSPPEGQGGRRGRDVLRHIFSPGAY